MTNEANGVAKYIFNRYEEMDQQKKEMYFQVICEIHQIMLNGSNADDAINKLYELIVERRTD